MITLGYNVGLRTTRATADPAEKRKKNCRLRGKGLETELADLVTPLFYTFVMKST